ncbi:ATP-binding protein [Romboutsia sp.]|uniref:ATP-binding protein n=1 Tax=Romboutsia sp. TaxID=1965302 RepID=UPI002C18F5F5|nr:ATP-binding protein [Romboutsia sp.]HSQ89516.1 ATP-binding protein [Romboutsia sp.]
MESSYNCDKCEDKGYIVVNEDGNEAVKFCECREVKLAKERLEKSGIADRVKTNTFKNYRVNNSTRENARNVCVKYITDFNRDKCLLLQGQVGSGKTHLAIATCNKLLEKYSVKYMSYTKDINELKFNMTDTDFYNKKIGEYRNTSILFIDDLFKGFEKGDYSRARAELRIMYDIINYRYDNKKAMIITTELSTDKLLELDEALASRIIEMTNNFETESKYRFDFKGKELNYRIYGL